MAGPVVRAVPEPPVFPKAQMPLDRIAYLSARRAKPRRPHAQPQEQESRQPAHLAARMGDKVAHTKAWSGLGWGALVGALIGVAFGALLIVATGGLGAIAVGAAIAAVAGVVGGAAGGALAGAAIGETFEGDKCSEIEGGPGGRESPGCSPDTMIEKAWVARAGLDQTTHDHAILCQGSKTVIVNNKPLARLTDKVKCSGKIQETCKKTIIGGPTETVVQPDPAIPSWLTTTLKWTGLAAGVVGAIAMAPAVGVGATILGFAGSMIGGELGGKYGAQFGAWVGKKMGNEERGAAIGAAAGGFLGSFAGGMAGTRMGQVGRTPAAPPSSRLGRAMSQADQWVSNTKAGRVAVRGSAAADRYLTNSRFGKALNAKAMTPGSRMQTAATKYDRWFANTKLGKAVLKDNPNRPWEAEPAATAKQGEIQNACKTCEKAPDGQEQLPTDLYRPPHGEDGPLEPLTFGDMSKSVAKADIKIREFEQAIAKARRDGNVQELKGLGAKNAEEYQAKLKFQSGDRIARDALYEPRAQAREMRENAESMLGDVQGNTAKGQPPEIVEGSTGPARQYAIKNAKGEDVGTIEYFTEDGRNQAVVHTYERDAAGNIIPSSERAMVLEDIAPKGKEFVPDAEHTRVQEVLQRKADSAQRVTDETLAQERRINELEDIRDQMIREDDARIKAEAVKARQREAARDKREREYNAPDGEGPRNYSWLQKESHSRAVDTAETYSRQKGWNPDEPGSRQRYIGEFSDEYLGQFESNPNRPLEDGWSQVTVHGGSSQPGQQADVFVITRGDGKGNVTGREYLTAAEMAQRMRDNGYTGGPVRLNSCNTGKTALPEGLAQDLANELGYPVVAPSRPLTGKQIIKGRQTWDGPVDNSARGRWRVYTPKGKAGAPKAGTVKSAADVGPMNTRFEAGGPVEVPANGARGSACKTCGANEEMPAASMHNEPTTPRTGESNEPSMAERTDKFFADSPPPKSAKQAGEEFATRLQQGPSKDRKAGGGSVVVNKRNGKTYEGLSGANDEPLAPQMKEAIEKGFITGPDGKPISLRDDGAPPHVCAEFRAANKALLEDPNAKLSDLDIYNFRPKNGQPIHRCANCQKSLEGANVVTDTPETRNAMANRQPPPPKKGQEQPPQTKLESQNNADAGGSANPNNKDPAGLANAGTDSPPCKTCTPSQGEEAPVQPTQNEGAGGGGNSGEASMQVPPGAAAQAGKPASKPITSGLPEGSTIIKQGGEGNDGWVVYKNADGQERMRFRADQAVTYREATPGRNYTTDAEAGLDPTGTKAYVIEGRHRAVGAAKGDNIPAELGGVPDQPGVLDYEYWSKPMDDAGQPVKNLTIDYSKPDLPKAEADKAFRDRINRW